MARQGLRPDLRAGVHKAISSGKVVVQKDLLVGTNGGRQLIDLITTGKEPLRSFLVKHSSDGERAFFLHTARQLLPKDQAQVGEDVVQILRKGIRHRLSLVTLPATARN